VTWYGFFLKDFAARHPKTKASKLREPEVEKWLFAERKRPWGQTTRRSGITILKLCLNWGVKKGSLAENPIRHMERPAILRRERVLGAAEHAEILGFYPEGDVFRDFLIAMRESGCRPGEVLKVEAKDANLELGIWVMHGKSSDVTGKKRVVYLTPALLEIPRRLVAIRPTGPIFRNEDGNPWNLQSVNLRFRRKKDRKKDPLDPSISAYTYRHTFTTDALVNGVPIATVAELLGHQSTQMVSQHYSHLSERTQHLREAVEQATKKG
jgi:integrase